jgi:hypothetical protein
MTTGVADIHLEGNLLKVPQCNIKTTQGQENLNGNATSKKNQNQKPETDNSKKTIPRTNTTTSTSTRCQERTNRNT